MKYNVELLSGSYVLDDDSSVIFCFASNGTSDCLSCVSNSYSFPTIAYVSSNCLNQESSSKCVNTRMSCDVSNCPENSSCLYFNQEFKYDSSNEFLGYSDPIAYFNATVLNGGYCEIYDNFNDNDICEHVHTNYIGLVNFIDDFSLNQTNLSSVVNLQHNIENLNQNLSSNLSSIDTSFVIISPTSTLSYVTDSRLNSVVDNTLNSFVNSNFNTNLQNVVSVNLPSVNNEIISDYESIEPILLTNNTNNIGNTDMVLGITESSHMSVINSGSSVILTDMSINTLINTSMNTSTLTSMPVVPTLTTTIGTIQSIKNVDNIGSNISQHLSNTEKVNDNNNNLHITSTDVSVINNTIEKNSINFASSTVVNNNINIQNNNFINTNVGEQVSDDLIDDLTNSVSNYKTNFPLQSSIIENDTLSSITSIPMSIPYEDPIQNNDYITGNHNYLLLYFIFAFAILLGISVVTVPCLYKYKNYKEYKKGLKKSESDEIELQNVF